MAPALSPLWASFRDKDEVFTSFPPPFGLEAFFVVLLSSPEMSELIFFDNFFAHLLLCQNPLDRSTRASRAARLAADAPPSSAISFSYLRSLSFFPAMMDSTRIMSSSMAQLKRFLT